jgi:hypothetical protein
MATYVCEPVPAYINNLCNEAELARVRSIAFVKRTANVSNPSDPAVWAALEANGDAKIIREIRGAYDGGVPVEATGFGSQQTRIQNSNHTLTVTDPKVIQNVRNGFWDAMRRNAYLYEVWLLGETQIWKTNGIPSVAPTIPITDDISQEVYVVATIKWQDPNIPVPYDKPGEFLDTIAA